MGIRQLVMGNWHLVMGNRKKEVLVCNSLEFLKGLEFGLFCFFLDSYGLVRMGMDGYGWVWGGAQMTSEFMLKEISILFTQKSFMVDGTGGYTTGTGGYTTIAIIVSTQVQTSCI